MRAKAILAIVLCVLMPSVAAAKAEVVHKSGECSTQDRVWTIAEIWQVDHNGHRELMCSMGVACNGKAWNTCDGSFQNDPEIGAPVRPYADAAHGDTVRASQGDLTNHLTSFIQTPTDIRVTTDERCMYRLFSLQTGALVYENLQPVSGGTEVTISIANLPAGPYMVLAYDPITGISLGYRTFMK